MSNGTPMKKSTPMKKRSSQKSNPVSGKKVQIYFDSRALEIINRLQESSGSASMANTLRDALAHYDWALEQIENGRCVGSFAPDGSSIKELAILRLARKST